MYQQVEPKSKVAMDEDSDDSDSSDSDSDSSSDEETDEEEVRLFLFVFYLTIQQELSGVQTGEGFRSIKCMSYDYKHYWEGFYISIVLFFYFFI